MHLPPTYPYSLSLHDALPIFPPVDRDRCDVRRRVSRDEERLVRRRATSRTVIVESFSRFHPDVTASRHLREKPCRLLALAGFQCRDDDINPEINRGREGALGKRGTKAQRLVDGRGAR